MNLYFKHNYVKENIHKLYGEKFSEKPTKRRDRIAFIITVLLFCRGKKAHNVIMDTVPSEYDELKDMIDYFDPLIQRPNFKKDRYAKEFLLRMINPCYKFRVSLSDLQKMEYLK